MAKKFLVAIDLKGNQLLNAVVHNASTAPTASGAGQIWFDSTGGVNKLKIYNGSAWELVGGTGVYYVGTTQVQSSSANQGLTGISSIALPGATSGTITLTPASVAGTTAITLPATSGTLALTSQLNSGTVTSVSVVSANGFAGTVATASSTPAITLTTSISGILKGSANALAAATSSDVTTLIGTTTLGSSTLTLGGTTTTIAGLTLTTPVIDSISASGATATTSIHPTVTTGSIAIGAGLTTGALNIATVGTGATPITIGHTNSTLTLGNFSSAGFLKTNASGLVSVDTNTYLTSSTGVTTFSGGTTGLTPSSATSGAITLSGTLGLSNGGTNASLTASNGGIVYSTGSAMAILAGTATAGKHLQSGSSGAPSWTTATFPSTATGTGTVLRADGTNWVASTATFADTYTANTILYAGSSNTVTSLATTSDRVLTSTGGSIAWSSSLPSGVTGSSLTSVGTLSGLAATGTVNFGSATTVTVPTPVNGTDAATKSYVDNVASGVNAHDAVKYATTAALGTTGNLVGGTITTTYANGTSGVGATLTIASSSTWTSITIDGQSLTVGDRVLIKNQSASLQNGIYTVTQVGTLANSTSFIFTRATDSDSTPELGAGDLVYVLNGTNNGGNGFIQTATVTTVGTDSITWTQFSGSSSVLAGLGLVPNAINPNQIDIGTASSSRIVVNADNIDLATVTRTNTTSQVGATFVQSITSDSYGRITAVTTGTHTLASVTVPGIASFNSGNFTVDGSGVVSLSANTISGVALGSNLATLTFGTGLDGGAATYNGSGAGSTLSFKSGSTSAGANDVGSSYTYATQKATATLTGNSSKTSWTISHNLNSRDIQVQVYQTSATPDTQYAEVEVDIVRTAAGTVTVTFASAPATGDTYNVVMVG